MTFDLTTEPAGPESADSAASEAARATPPNQRDPREATPARTRRRRAGDFTRILFSLLPLPLVLGMQTLLSLRLTNTAFEDEALVLLTGHQEIKVLFHGSKGTASLAAYFSGAPSLYPVLAAAVDGRYGLQAVRLLSLFFMLGATTLLWSSTQALFGRSAAIGAVAVFAFAGPTLFLGNFAIYDVPAVFLFAASLRILIATARRNMWTCLLAVPTTVLAIATSYATAMYLPVLALVATFSAAAVRNTAAVGRARRLKHLVRGALFAAVVVVLLGGLLAILGPGYRRGFESATTARVVGVDRFGMILGDAVQWGVAALVLGLLGALAVARRHRADPSEPHRVAPALLTLALAASVLPAPAYQLHIHTLQSLQKHIEIGLLFASVAAGVAVSIPLRAAWRAPARCGVAVLAVLAFAAVGAYQSGKLFHYWPNTTTLISTLKQSMGKGGGHYLAESPSVPQYYTADLPRGGRNDWQNTYFFGYADHAGKYVSGVPAYKQAIADHYFKVIVLSHKETPALDDAIGAPLKADGGYRLVRVVAVGDVFGTTDYDVWKATK